MVRFLFTAGVMEEHQTPPDKKGVVAVQPQGRWALVLLAAMVGQILA
jgi:hypothetical protein